MNKKKNVYEEASIEVIVFEKSDIITDSTPDFDDEDDGAIVLPKDHF